MALKILADAYSRDPTFRARFQRESHTAAISRLTRAVSAPGAVECSRVPVALCDGSNFLMHRQQLPGDSWITCTGGSYARVYLW